MQAVYATTGKRGDCHWLVALFLAVCFLARTGALAQTNFATLTTDGGWCWFSDPRAIFYHGTLYYGYVRGSDGYTGLNTFNLQTGTTTNLWLSSLTAVDDHNVPGIQIREDGTLLVLWARHGSDTFFSYRQSTSTNPVSPANWGPEQQTATVSGLTYCNPYQLTNESGKVYEFSRDLNYNPTVFSSTDGGNTWSAPQLMIKTGTGSTRPYVKYCSDYNSRIDVLYTDAHPDNYTTSLYEMYYQGGAFYQTDGTFLTNYATLPLQHDAGQHGTVVYQYNAAASSDPNQWIATARAWCWDMAYQTNGAPVCVFQVKVDAVTGTAWSDARIYYYYARWTGTSWQKRFIAQAGRPLYNGQPDYGGGIGIDPKDINTVYFSSDAANPLDLSTTTNVPLGSHYEIWKGVTADGGLTFTWSAVTTNSTVDNCRPYVPRRFGGEPCVLWWRGVYNSYLSFSSAIVGLFTTAVPTPVVTVPAATPMPRLAKANNTVNLNLTNSWVGGMVPNTGYVALWDSTVTGANTVALGANASWSGICVTNPGGAVTIGAGNTLTVGSSGIDLSGAAAGLAINSGLILGAGNQAWNVTNGQALTISGAFTRGGGASLVIGGGAGGVAFNPSLSYGLVGPWAVIKNAGTAANNSTNGFTYATTSGGKLVPYIGATALTTGFGWTSTNPSSQNYDISAVGAVIGVPRTCNTIRYTGVAGTQTFGNGGTIPLTNNGILNAGSGTLTLAKGSSTGELAIGANNEMVLNAASAGITISLPIIGTGGAVTVTGSGANAVTLSGVNTYTGGTILDAGTLNLGNASALGGTSGPLTVNGGSLDLGALAPVVGAVVITGGTILDGTLTGASFAVTNAGAVTVSANLAGASAGLIKNGNGPLTLSGANSYAGNTMVYAGALAVNGNLGTGLISVTGGTLAGAGTIAGPVTVQTGGSLAPGADTGSIGGLTINNSLTLLSGSVTVVKVDKTGDGIVNDQITGLTNLVCGGTLIVTNIGATPLAAGDTVKVFSSARYGGNFTSSNLPVLSAGLAWTNRLAVDGTLAVVSNVSAVLTNLVWSVTGTNLSLVWPADHQGWRLQTQTNSLNNGLGTNWVTVPNSTNVTGMLIPIAGNNGCVFFRLASP